MKTYLQDGYSLLGILVLTTLLGIATAQVFETHAIKQRQVTLQAARQAQTLEHIKSSLLGFAGTQGVHSQSHIGHMPCPAVDVGLYAQTVCLNKLTGYLPLTSKTAINYLNRSVDPRVNEAAQGIHNEWSYAVSAQLVQPNELGWGRWVDFKQPSLTVQADPETGAVLSNVAAVVARAIRPIDKHSLEVTPPYVVITVDELRAHIANVQFQHLNETLRTWAFLNPQAATFNTPENLAPHGSPVNGYQALDSECSCRCTRTRCSCGCKADGRWQSHSPCTTSSARCTSNASITLCTSSSSEPCVFAGPARMQSHWPVSRFEPVAASNKSCRPTSRGTCPLSKDTTACVCDFSWPDITKSALTEFVLQLPGTP